MSLRSRVRTLERARAETPAVDAVCPVCRGEGGGRLTILKRVEPGEKADPGPPLDRGCPACGKLAKSRLTILLRPTY